jgi:hypothetical protein
MSDFLRNAIEVITKRTGGLGNKDWTRALHARLVDFAVPQYKLYPEEKPYKGEYLVDFCIYDGEKGPILACESQLYPPFGGDAKNLEGIEWAFDKLRGVKAPNKVLIFEAEFEDTFPVSIHSELVENYIRYYERHSVDEWYVFVQLDGDESKVFCWRPSKDGLQLPSANFNFDQFEITKPLR